MAKAKFEENLEVAVQEADKDPVVVEPLEKALQLIAVLHERVKRLEEAKGWHDVEECAVFCSE